MMRGAKLKHIYYYMHALLLTIENMLNNFAPVISRRIPTLLHPRFGHLVVVRIVSNVHVKALGTA